MKSHAGAEKALLERLVAYDSVSHKPLDGLAGWIADRLDGLGFRVELHHDAQHPGKCNVIASKGPQGTDGLVISGHMDVVPTEGQPWSSDPFVATERDGRLYGRGTADMKGFIASTLAALDRLAQRPLQRELLLLWTHDEEVGCLGSARLAHDLPRRGAPLPSQCLIGEPTDFQVLRMHPGHVAVEVEVGGAAAHSSRPDLGLNAIEGAAAVVRICQELALELQAEPHDIPEMDRPFVPLNVATIHGGSAINIVPDRCVVQLGYRPLPGMSAHDVFHRLERKLHEARLPHRLATRVLRVTPSMLTPADAPLAADLLAHASTPRIGSASFATDGGNLEAIGLQTMVFGPGSITVAHQADEYVEIAALARAVDVLETVIAKRCA